MTRSISFTIDGPIRGKARIRTRGKQFFKDDKTRKAETDIGWSAKTAMAHGKLLEGPLAVELTISMEVPKSWSIGKRGLALMNKYATGKPDCDNSAKMVCDAMNKIVYADDSQIADLIVRRRYSSESSAIVSVSELGPWQLRKRT